ncbi:hypothetical protein [Xanthomonas sp. SI]|uniref:hypothetical protein n=1 Tax=Xanthomonas sp. SI TaxID=2724123 RepID=UPI00163B0CD2|nr:hypothetical protein [Xanthomonas sp. SI]
MKLMMAILFMSSLCGVVIFYSMYFYFLNEFRIMIKNENAVSWVKVKKTGVTEIQAAYKALQLSKSGVLGDSVLSSSALRCRKKTVLFLYLGIFSFMTLLVTGLADSLAAG